MTRRTRAAARVACLAFLLAAVPAVGADEAAVERCFQLRDDDPATAVAEAQAALASPEPDPEIEIKLRTCLARSLALTGDAERAQAEVTAVDALLARHPMPRFATRSRIDAHVHASSSAGTSQATEPIRDIPAAGSLSRQSPWIAESASGFTDG